MWFSAQGARDGVTNMDVVTSPLAEVRRVMVVLGRLREVVGWAVVVAERSAVAEVVAVVVGSFVAVNV